MKIIFIEMFFLLITLKQIMSSFKPEEFNEVVYSFLKEKKFNIMDKNNSGMVVRCEKYEIPEDFLNVLKKILTETYKDYIFYDSELIIWCYSSDNKQRSAIFIM